MATLKATESPKPGGFTGTTPEFGRVADVARNYGLKRGTTYNLLRDGKIKGCLLRVCGRRSGVRLFDMASIRDLIRSQMKAESEPAIHTDKDAAKRGGQAR